VACADDGAEGTPTQDPPDPQVSQSQGTGTEVPDSTPSENHSAELDRSSRGKKRQRRRRKRPRITCAICHRTFSKLTAKHLRSHGMSIAQYQRVFSSPCAPQPSPSPAPPTQGWDAYHLERASPAPQLDPALVSATANALVESDDFVAKLADETSELLFSTHFKEQLRHALGRLLGRRMELHAQATAHLDRVRRELDQPWRIEAGGKDGEPTPTPHLIGMAGEAHHEVVKSEEALLKTIRLALEESRQNKEVLAALGGRPSFTGEGESVPVPPELDAAERETIRSLVHMLQQEVTARAAQHREPIDVQVTSAPAAPSEDSTPPPAPEPPGPPPVPPSPFPES